MSRFNPNHLNAAQVFQAAQDFKHQCLINQQSLFLPNQEIWTAPHFQSLTTNFVDQPDTGGGTFYQKLELQLATCTPLDIALMTEIFWIVQLPATNLRPPKKLKRLEEIWNIKPAAPFPVQSNFLDKPVLSGLGSAGPGYNQYFPSEMAFAVQAFAALVAMAPSARTALLNGSGFDFAEWLHSIPSGKGRQLYHTLCHVLFPDSFERMFSQNNKNKVMRGHKIWTKAMVGNRPLQDAALLDLRSKLEIQFPGAVDYYSEPIGTLLKKKPEGEDEPEGDDEESDSTPPPLRVSDNVIFYGPPGTGKTYQMQERMREAFEAGEDFTFVSFHPSYSYEEFVGGLRPTAAPDGNGIAVTYEKGPFRKLCEQAHADPSRRFTLFIDEINRANVAKVFGELITLIEPSKRVRAGSEPNDGDGTWVRLPGSRDEDFGVPDNLDIVASMNTADRSVATMDVALRRRFRFVECPPQPELISNSPALGPIDLRKLMTRLNDRLEFMLDRNHAIGHATFMFIDGLPELRRRLAERVIPQLQEYFFDDMEKVRLALTGRDTSSVFFLERKLTSAMLFPGGAHLVGSAPRVSLAVGNPSSWTEADIVKLYDDGTAIAPDMPDESATF
ncbi:McrB family protein [Pigmentiphaga kullae]|uniref:5-methylcytosine-specific restriction protein B n=1 Tax=Pigmentiphaga kullae TaxID=151784 RepID=A0A4Q7NE19_9BURK|nr:AAA family ATPase [Pigmentiphaga kullae]RZS81209.1 5-methylcytosine-specific restriction protein B [Pigmentiphaga kullae]